MMVVVGHAHVDEVKATEALERALARVRATSLIAAVHERALACRSQREAARRCLKARIALGEARAAFMAARKRHSRWYRAYLRARHGVSHFEIHRTLGNVRHYARTCDENGGVWR